MCRVPLFRERYGFPPKADRPAPCFARGYDRASGGRNDRRCNSGGSSRINKLSRFRLIFGGWDMVCITSLHYY